MCGIVGYVGREERSQDVILDGLRRLEYRGYDSAGIAVLEDGKLRVVRALGKLVNLESTLRDVPVRGPLGIGHTRWATHGVPSEENAHPHRVGTVAIIHNGIVENYRALRAELGEQGCEFSSETDTEIIAHLIHRARRAGESLLHAVRSATQRLEGSYAIVVIDETEPDKLVATKDGGSPCIASSTADAGYVASDISAILPYTRQMVPLEDGDVALLSPGELRIFDRAGDEAHRQVREIQWDPVQAEKGGYDRFMQKEIYEQPRAISDTIAGRALVGRGEIDLDGIELDPDWLKKLHAVHLVGMGTARHACLIGAKMIEEFARVPTLVDLSSEYRYRNPVLDGDVLVIPVSQSGETADTLGALREAKERGVSSLGVVNVPDSSIARECDNVLYTHAGLEIGVASTKGFTTQIVALHLIALKLGVLRGSLDREALGRQMSQLRRLPRLVDEAVGLWDEVFEVARRFFRVNNFLFLGRGVGFAVAMEGALKLKEISYIHAEGYAAGEMKHGPIALIDENMPVVIVANRSNTYSKLLGNAAEVRARQGTVIAIAERGDEEIANYADEVIYVPPAPDPLSSIINVIPLQIFAYQIATLRGTDVDQPRNLAKSVTVE